MLLVIEIIESLEMAKLRTLIRRCFMSEFHDLTMNAITGEPLSFERHKGQACLVVNLASE